MSEPAVIAVPGGRYVFGIEVSWLPDLVGSGVRGYSDDPIGEAFGRQVAMLRALAEGAPRGSVLQLRLLVGRDRRGDRLNTALRVCLVGGASRTEDALALRAHTLTTFPPEFPVVELPHDEVRAVLGDGTDWSHNCVAELRRAIESADPELDLTTDTERLIAPVLLRWEWTRYNLLSSISALLGLPAGSQLVVHLEPRPVSTAALAWMRDEVERYRVLIADSPQTLPLLSAALTGYLRWMRDLPRSCLHMRVALFCPTGVPFGVAEAVGADLTRSWESRGSGAMVGTFQVVRPATGLDVHRTLMLLEQLRSEPTLLPKFPEVAELLFLFDPHEANAAFRIPLPGPEGMPGVRIAPVSRLPLGLPAAGQAAGPAAWIGVGASGQSVGLSLDELNRHLLVCGLPGFGKSTTLGTLLYQLRSLPEPVPFLVIDPAKDDYQGLFARVGGDVIDLTPERLAFNPLVVPDGVSTFNYANRITAAFDAAFSLAETFPAASVLLARAVHLVYSERRDATLHRLYAAVGDLIATSSYGAQTKGELRAALLGRLELVVDGSMGVAMAGSSRSGIDWATVLSRPTLIQLRNFSAPRERSLLVAFLMAGLISYRERHHVPGLGHLMVLEEAHRVLGRVGGATSEGARTFIDAMAELRGAGEGIVIVEQAPSRLAPEALKLVGSLLTHRLVDAEERNVIAASMLMSGGEEDLARLQVGSAVMLTADSVAPVIVQVKPVSDDQIKVSATVSSTLATVDAPVRLWCQDCPVMCRGSAGLRAGPLPVAVDKRPVPALVLRAAADRTGTDRPPEAYCLAAHSLAQVAPDAMAWRALRQELLTAYRRAVGPGGKT